MRLKNIILTDLASEQLKARERIERAMNSTDDLGKCIGEIKSQLRELVLISQMIETWQQITPSSQLLEDNDKNYKHE